MGLAFMYELGQAGIGVLHTWPRKGVLDGILL